MKKILSILLAVVMFCTVFAGIEMPAKAYSYISAFISAQNLQEYVDRAQPGETIGVTAQGTANFSSPVVINKPITIDFHKYFKDGRSSYIKSTNNNRLFVIKSSGVTLNFLDNKTILTASSGDIGGAIYIDDDGKNAVIKGARFENCTTDEEGGAIFTDGGGTQILNCYFKDCHSTDQDGGAIFVRDSNITIKNCVFDILLYR